MFERNDLVLSRPKSPMTAEQTASTLTRLNEKITTIAMIEAAAIIAVPELELKLIVARHLYDDCLLVRDIRQRLFALQVGEASSDEVQSGWQLKGDCLSALSASASDVLIKKFIIDGKDSALADVRMAMDQVDPICDAPTRDVYTKMERALRSANESISSEIERPDRVAAANEAGRSATFEWSDRVVVKGRPSRDARFRPDAPTSRLDLRVENLGEQVPKILHYNLLDLEIITIEACCRSMLEFPEMPWAFVCDMARQCWDEARHAWAFYRRHCELGCELGAYGHSFHLWDWAAGEELAVRLFIHQRIGEWLGVGAANYCAERLEQEGDTETGRVFRFVERDEVTHVLFGNRWIRFLCPTEEQFKIAESRALHCRSTRNGQPNENFTDEKLFVPPRRAAYEWAGFSLEEIEADVARYDRFGSFLQLDRTARS